MVPERQMLQTRIERAKEIRLNRLLDRPLQDSRRPNLREKSKTDQLALVEQLTPHRDRVEICAIFRPGASKSVLKIKFCAKKAALAARTTRLQVRVNAPSR